MDHSLDIILPEKRLRVSGLNVRSVWWGGEVHECVPRQFFTDNGIYFAEMTGSAVREIMLSKTDIEHPALISLDRKKHITSSVITGRELDDLFARLCKSEFEIYYWEDDGSIEEEYAFDKYDDLSQILINSAAAGKNIRIIRNKGE